MLLSGRNEAEAEKAERVVMAFGLEWTVVRCAFFAQNFNEGAWLDEVLAGAVSLPVDQVQEPFVDVDDIADVVVAALTDDRHVGQLYELTGPRLLGFRDAVAEIGAAAGRDISFVSMSMNVMTTITNTNAALIANRMSRSSNVSSIPAGPTVNHHATPYSAPVSASTIR